MLNRLISLWLLLGLSTNLCAATLEQKVKILEQQVAELLAEKEKNAKQAKSKESEEPAEKAKDSGENGIRVGGAVRFNYSFEQYDKDNKDRGGDLDFDLFRIDLNGSIGDVQLSAQYRWFEYMNVIHHAWVGYNFTEQQQGKIGITKVPFGILPFASHSYFFSANYYLGLEDDYDLGLNYSYQADGTSLDLAFYKNGRTRRHRRLCRRSLGSLLL